VLLFLTFSARPEHNCVLICCKSITFFPFPSKPCSGWFRQFAAPLATCRRYSNQHRFKNLTCILAVQPPSYNQLHRPFCFTRNQALRNFDSALTTDDVTWMSALCRICQMVQKGVTDWQDTRKGNLLMFSIHFLTVRTEGGLNFGHKFNRTDWQDTRKGNLLMSSIHFLTVRKEGGLNSGHKYNSLWPNDSTLVAMICQVRSK